MTDRLETLKALRAALDEEIGRADFWAWHRQIHRGTFKERFKAMRTPPGPAANEQQKLLRVLHDLNIEIEINRKRKAGKSVNAAIREVAGATSLSPDRVKQIYRAQRNRGG